MYECPECNSETYSIGTPVEQTPRSTNFVYMLGYDYRQCEHCKNREIYRLGSGEIIKASTHIRLR